MNRIVGLETEYGCLTAEPSGSAPIVTSVRNWVFAQNRFGMADVHQRDWDEPAGNGGFLYNGGRVYVDMGHLEYCTPECLDLRDLLIYDRAGDRLLLQALSALEMGPQAGFIRNNIDHYSGATFGCHENYLVRRTAPLNEQNVMSLLAFLTIRVLYTGAGRVGALKPMDSQNQAQSPPATGIHFQISQRADYINNDLFEWVQFNRAIINTRDEPLADGRRFRRLHLLHGDTSVLPSTLYLKAGTTALVLDLLEIDQLPRVVLADAVATFRALSVAPDGPWNVPMADGNQRSALELLHEYQAAADLHFRGRDEETNLILDQWALVLDRLSGDKDLLVGVVDWVSKYWLFREFVERENAAWDDSVLKSLDLEFHQIDPEKCLGLAVANQERLWTPDDDEVNSAILGPPKNTRAAVRSEAMHALRQAGQRHFVDWEVIDAEGLPSLHLLNPFESNPAVAELWLKELRERARRE